MPILVSKLDLDFYKLTMQQYIYEKHKTVPVEFTFKCRTTGVQLARMIDTSQLRDELDYARSLTLTKEEVEYLKSLKTDKSRIFSDDYLEWLKSHELPDYLLETTDDGSKYQIRFSGEWVDVTLWETLCLSVISELYGNALIKQEGLSKSDVLRTGMERLLNKAEKLQNYPDIRIIEFGTRRRYSANWQVVVLSILSEMIPKQLVGTSNVAFAMKLGIPPIGTMAHELDMAMMGVLYAKGGQDVHEKLKATHDIVMDEWEELYPYGLRIDLPDTFGSAHALGRMSEKRLLDWRGERHDSGDPNVFTDRVLEKYREFGIDPKEEGKILVYSDGLEVDLIIELCKCYAHTINVSFGWGTNLTNDMGLEHISIVVKLTKSCGVNTVKLSDNLAKAIGKTEDIEFYKELFDYEEEQYKECKY